MIEFKQTSPDIRDLCKQNVDISPFFFQHYGRAEDGLVCRLAEPMRVQADAALSALHAQGKLIRREELTFGPLIGKGEFGEVYQVTLELDVIFLDI